LYHVYPNGVIALEDVNLSIRKGGFVAIIGENGSGKTTLIEHFNGLLKPSHGRVLIEGKDVEKMSVAELARKIAYVFQNLDHQIFTDTVHDEVAFGPRSLGFSKEEIEQRVHYALKAVGLEEKADSATFALSKGEKTRLALASVLSMKPEILVLDEPTTGLDYETMVKIMNLFRRLNSEGKTIILVTHEMSIVAEYAHRAIVLSEGKVIADGSTREIFKRIDVLEKSSLKPPPVNLLSRELGFGDDILTVKEICRIIGD